MMFPDLIFASLMLLYHRVARDINGTALENAPFEQVFHHPESSRRFQNHLPVQVQSCWNGIAVMDPAPIYAVPHVKFRMADLGKAECSASECSLICNDYTKAGECRDNAVVVWFGCSMGLFFVLFLLLFFFSFLVTDVA